MPTLIKPLTRDQLASFLPDEEAIRRFEKLYQIAATDTPTDIVVLYELVQEAAIDAVTAMTTAIQANDSLLRIAASLEVMASNPQALVPEIPDDLTPAVNVGTLAVQNADNVDVGALNAESYSVNGNVGASGTGTVITAMTVEDGIITAITIS